MDTSKRPSTDVNQVCSKSTIKQSTSDEDFEKVDHCQSSIQELLQLLTTKVPELVEKAKQEIHFTESTDIRKSTIKSLSQENDDLREQVKKLDEQRKEADRKYQDEESKLQHTIQTQQKKLAMHNSSKKTEQSHAEKETKYQLDNAEKQLRETEKELRKTKDELKDTHNRLSKTFSDNLTDNNPEVTDLSDQDRPTKLAERFQELYDNQWTDAFDSIDELYKGSEENTIEKILNILLDAYRFCEKEANRQRKYIQMAVTQDSTSENSLPSSVKKLIKDFQRHVAVFSGKQLYQKYQLISNNHAVPEFVKSCFELCWFMVVQDPPLVFGPIVTKGEKLNTNMYKAYTIRGDRVAFLVWPTLLLHENGPVLCKGIAQGITNERNKIATTLSEQKKDVASKLATKESDEGINLHKSYNAHLYASDDFMRDQRSQQTSSYNQITMHTTDVNYTPAQCSPPLDVDVDKFLRCRERYGRETTMDIIGHQKYDDIRSYCIQNGII